MAQGLPELVLPYYRIKYLYGLAELSLIEYLQAYWEVKVQQGGVFSCGLASPAADLSTDLGRGTELCFS